ncbi:MAG: flagellar hook assembly protein FlgD [Rhodospirillaceae bacterium]
MAVAGITTPLGGAIDEVTTSKNKLAKDLNSFLTLLTSQLKNQDPLSPMDSSEFTNQLVEFAQVEQQIGMNDNLTSIIGLVNQSIVSSAVNYIGTVIEGESNQVPLQDGKLKAAYGLNADANNVTVVVRNEAGDIIYSRPMNAAADKTQGVHSFEWDGKDSNGNQLPDAPYTLSVTATGADDKPVENYITAFGRVTGVTSINGKTVLLIGKVGIPTESVLSVTEREESGS